MPSFHLCGPGVSVAWSGQFTGAADTAIGPSIRPEAAGGDSVQPDLLFTWADGPVAVLLKILCPFTGEEGPAGGDLLALFFPEDEITDGAEEEALLPDAITELEDKEGTAPSFLIGLDTEVEDSVEEALLPEVVPVEEDEGAEALLLRLWYTAFEGESSVPVEVLLPEVITGVEDNDAEALLIGLCLEADDSVAEALLPEEEDKGAGALLPGLETTEGCPPGEITETEDKCTGALLPGL